jgi:hypothetical protein
VNQAYSSSRFTRRLSGIILVALGAVATQHGLGCVDQPVCLGYALSQRLLAGLDFLLMLEAALGAVGFFGHLRATLHREGGFIPHNECANKLGFAPERAVSAGTVRSGVVRLYSWAPMGAPGRGAPQAQRGSAR